MNWDDLRIFKIIAEDGSIRKAASQLKQSHSTLSRRLEALESCLRTKLFYRLSSGLTLTEAGADLLSEIMPLTVEFERIERKIVGRDQAIGGDIKVTLPSVFATHVLFPDMLKFQEQWPQISLQIHTSNDVLDLHNGEADIAIRLTNSPDESLVGRKVGDIYQAAYASVDYVESLKYRDVSDVKWVKPGCFTPVKDIQIGCTSTNTQDCDLVVNHIDLQLHAAEMSKGVSLLPCFMADRREGLLRISKPYHHFSVWLLCTKELRDNKRMQLFRQFITERLREHAPLLEGKTKPLYISKIHNTKQPSECVEPVGHDLGPYP